MKHLNKAITLLLLVATTVSVSAQELVVFSVSGKVQQSTSEGKKDLKVSDKLTPNTTITIPYDASVRLVDQANRKQYVIKTQGTSTVKALMEQKGTNVVELTQRFADYMVAQMTGASKKMAQRHSDVATVTREIQKFKKDKEEEELDDFEKARREMQAMKDEYDDFKQKVTEEYYNFQKAANEEYAKFMKDAWKTFDKEPPIPQPVRQEVKPLRLPKNQRGKTIKGKPIKIDQVIAPTLPEPQPVPIDPIALVDVEKLKIEKQDLDPVKMQPILSDPIKNNPFKQNLVVSPLKVAPQHFEGLQFTFFGTKLRVRFDKKDRFRLPNISEDAITDGWIDLANKGFNNTVLDCLSLRDELKLSDWGYLLLLEAVGEAAFGKSNESTLFTAYLFCQSGYQMRLAKSSNRLYFLFGSRHKIFNVSFFTLNGEKFYPRNCDEDALSICALPYPAEQALSLVVPDEPVFDDDPSQPRTISSEEYPDIKVNVSVNKNLINFFNGYPTSEIGGSTMSRWAMYANTPLAEEVRKQLYPVLKEKIKGKTQKEAVNRLLNFVQTGLVYEYDDKVWGGDRVFFAEESLYYPYADCEDRSILFTRLVRDLVGLKTVLIYYPGHLAAAVHFTAPVDGDYLVVDGDRFTIADPTYIGAPVGMTMPNMDNQSAQAIVLQPTAQQ